eukprot:COSAG03_NODE_866_length_5583_cov_57.343545_2_plen_295_part_00
MQEEACRHTLSALHTMMRHAVHRALFGAHSTIVCLTLFSLPDGFTLPSLAQIRSFSGNDDGDEGDVDVRIRQLEQQVALKESQILDKLRSDVRDGKLALPADASVAAQREAFAFQVDPKRVLLLGCDLQPDGMRSILCGPDPGKPVVDHIQLDQELFAQVMFHSKVTAKQVTAIHRRNLLPAECFRDAPTLPSKVVGMAGGQGKLAKHDELRIKQQTLLRPVQTQFRTLAAGSDAFIHIRDLLDQLKSGQGPDGSPIFDDTVEMEPVCSMAVEPSWSPAGGAPASPRAKGGLAR